MNILKKILLTSSLLIAFSALSANAAVIEFKLNDVNFTTEKDGVITKKVSEAAPFISTSNRTMIPVRAISEAFGAEISWFGETQTVLIKNAEKEIKLTIGNETAYVNNEAVTLDSVPVIINDRTFVPLRFIGETLDNNVNYVSSTSHIVIDDTPVLFRSNDIKISFAEFKLFNELTYNTYLSQKSLFPTDEEYNAAILDLSLRNVPIMVMILDNYSDIGFSADDIDNVKSFIETDKNIMDISLEGLNALVHEKSYYGTGMPVINHITSNQTNDLNTHYENSYVCAKHVLVEDESTAKTVYEKAIAGEDFDALVKTYGTDPGMGANSDGYVFTKGEMVLEFEEASFALKPGEISAPVKTAYGYHIIKREALPALLNETANLIAIKIIENKLSESPVPELLISAEELYTMIGK